MRVYFRCVVLSVMVMLFAGPPINVSAATENSEVAGKIYEFGKKSHYEFQEDTSFKKADSGNTYGTFHINGNVGAVSEKSGVPSYEVKDGNLDLYYEYEDTMLNADNDAWHLVDDKSKKVAGKKLDSDIMKGAIIIQISKDGMNWVEEVTICNAFSDVPIRTTPVYSTADVQLINGCYYRIVVAYELAKRTKDSNILFINTDKYDYKKCAEVYEFYAYTKNDEASRADNDQTYGLGTKVRTKNFDGYFGEKLIDKKDAHYGWDIGNFFVSGYTDAVKDADDNVVFLKNVGDKVTLWHHSVK